MSTSSSDSVFSFGVTRITIAPGATQGVLVYGLGQQNSSVLKMLSGGTLEIQECAEGVTLTAAQLAALAGKGYPMDIGEKISIDGAPRYYLTATGATCVASLLLGKTQGS